MNLLIFYFLVLAGMASSALFRDVFMRVVVCIVGIFLMFLLSHIKVEYRAIDGITAVYPLELNTARDIKMANKALAIGFPDTDSLLVRYDPVHASYGDTLYAYKLREETEGRWFYFDRTICVIDNKPNPAFEAQLK